MRQNLSSGHKTRKNNHNEKCLSFFFLCGCSLTKKIGLFNILSPEQRREGTSSEYKWRIIFFQMVMVTWCCFSLPCLRSRFLRKPDFHHLTIVNQSRKFIKCQRSDRMTFRGFLLVFAGIGIGLSGLWDCVDCRSSYDLTKVGHHLNLAGFTRA